MGRRNPQNKRLDGVGLDRLESLLKKSRGNQPVYTTQPQPKARLPEAPENPEMKLSEVKRRFGLSEQSSKTIMRHPGLIPFVNKIQSFRPHVHIVGIEENGAGYVFALHDSTEPKETPPFKLKLVNGAFIFDGVRTDYSRNISWLFNWLQAEPARAAKPGLQKAGEAKPGPSLG